MKYIIRNSGGLIPTYLTETNSTCHASEAFTFNSIDDAILFGKAHLNGRHATVRVIDTLTFVAHINY